MASKSSYKLEEYFQELLFCIQGGEKEDRSIISPAAKLKSKNREVSSLIWL